jgi:hypothetical protein
MFVRHITEQDVFDNGFLLNPITNETFSRQQIDTKHVSTYMQIWIDINSYRYRVVTDREGVVEDGHIFSRDILGELVTEFFDNDLESFLRRNLPNKFPEWNDVKISWFMGSLKNLEKSEKQKVLINLFGEL